MLAAGKMSGRENDACDLFHRHIPAPAQIHVSGVLNCLRKALDHLDTGQASPQFGKPALTMDCPNQPRNFFFFFFAKAGFAERSPSYLGLPAKAGFSPNGFFLS